MRLTWLPLEPGQEVVPECAGCCARPLPYPALLRVENIVLWLFSGVDRPVDVIRYRFPTTINQLIGVSLLTMDSSTTSLLE